MLAVIQFASSSVYLSEVLWRLKIEVFWSSKLSRFLKEGKSSERATYQTNSLIGKTSPFSSKRCGSTQCWPHSHCEFEAWVCTMLKQFVYSLSENVKDHEVNFVKNELEGKQYFTANGRDTKTVFRTISLKISKLQTESWKTWVTTSTVCYKQLAKESSNFELKLLLYPLFWHLERTLCYNFFAFHGFLIWGFL